MHPTRVVFFCVLIAACQSAETPQQADERITAESEAARTELEAIQANFERWYSAGAVDSAASILTEGHSWLPPNQPAGAGRSQWISTNKPLVATGKFGIHHVTESVLASGPLAVMRGRYVLTFAPGAAAQAGAKASADTGKYLWQWRKVDGRWLVEAAAWNSDLPSQK